jgi:acyl dehydratase
MPSAWPDRPGAVTVAALQAAAERTTMHTLTLSNMGDYVGEEIALTDWLTITQDMVDGFARATLDPDWMHVDVERSKVEGPFGGTIVQGFLCSSLVIYFSHEYGGLPVDAAYGLNYGIDRARYLTPVLTGSRVRDRITLTEYTERGEGRFLIKTNHVLELEGSERPAAIVDWLTLNYAELDY